jgi:hypothetical protein
VIPLKRFFILLLVLVAFFAFTGLSAARDDQCCPKFSFGKVTYAVDPIAKVMLDHKQLVTLDFTHSAVGVCNGVQNNPAVIGFPVLGNSAALRVVQDCQECLAIC